MELLSEKKQTNFKVLQNRMVSTDSIFRTRCYITMKIVSLTKLLYWTKLSRTKVTKFGRGD